MQISLAFHIIGFVLWAGGLMLLTRILSLGIKNNVPVTPLARRLMLGYIFPGLVISLLSGLHQLSVKGLSFYFSQGWFHTKLTLVVLLFVATVLTWVEIQRALSGMTARKGILGASHGLAALALLGAVFLTKLSI